LHLSFFKIWLSGEVAAFLAYSAMVRSCGSNCWFEEGSCEVGVEWGARD